MGKTEELSAQKLNTREHAWYLPWNMVVNHRFCGTFWGVRGVLVVHRLWRKLITLWMLPNSAKENLPVYFSILSRRQIFKNIYQYISLYFQEVSQTFFQIHTETIKAQNHCFAITISISGFENPWSELKREFHIHKPKTINELKMYCIKEWTNLVRNYR